MTGVDVSRAMLRLARRNVPEARFLISEMTRVNPPADSFDGAVAFYSLIHVPRKRHALVYRKLRRILKPGAPLLVTAGGAKAREGIEDFHGVSMFWSSHAPTEAVNTISRSGFEVMWSRVLKIGGERHLWILARKR